MSSTNSLFEWIESNDNVEVLEFDEPVKSVRDAMKVSGYPKNEFIKTIVLKHKNENIVVAASITASARVDKKLLLEGVNPKRWRMASPDEVMNFTGYPVGGVPPIGLPRNLIRYVDPRVIEREYVIGGGGSITKLIRFPSKLIVEDGVEIKVISKG